MTPFFLLSAAGTPFSPFFHVWKVDSSCRISLPYSSHSAPPLSQAFSVVGFPPLLGSRIFVFLSMALIHALPWAWGPVLLSFFSAWTKSSQSAFFSLTGLRLGLGNANGSLGPFCIYRTPTVMILASPFSIILSCLS